MFQFKGSLRAFASAASKRSKQSNQVEVVASKFINAEGRVCELDFKAVEAEGDRILGNFEKELAKFRIGRASPSMLDAIKVSTEAYTAPLNSISTVSVQDNQHLLVNPYEASHTKSIIAAINSANLNLNAVADGSNRIIVTTPKVTKELRESAAKHLSTISEGTKKRLRDMRQEALDACKTDVTDKDVRRQNERQLQAALEKLTERLEAFLAAKQKELLTQ